MANLLRIPANTRARMTGIYDEVTSKVDVIDFAYDFGTAPLGATFFTGKWYPGWDDPWVLACLQVTDEVVDLSTGWTISFWWKASFPLEPANYFYSPLGLYAWTWPESGEIGTGNGVIEFVFSVSEDTQAIYEIGLSVYDTADNGDWFGYDWTSGGPAMDVWHFICAYGDNANAYLTFDNQLIGSTPVGSVGSLAVWPIGNNGGSFDEWSWHAIDELSIWQRVLTADERAALWNSGNGALAFGSPWAYWKMDERNGNRRDATGHGHDGVPIDANTLGSIAETYLGRTEGKL